MSGDVTNAGRVLLNLSELHARQSEKLSSDKDNLHTHETEGALTIAEAHLVGRHVDVAVRVQPSLLVTTLSLDSGGSVACSMQEAAAFTSEQYKMYMKAREAEHSRAYDE
eukprot:6375150-Amphidinium_carterae.1